MKITLDKNFLITQFVLIIIFYLINSFLLNDKKSKSHFTTTSKSKKIESGDLMLYVLAQQFGVPGSTLTPVSNEAIIVSAIQKIIFTAYATGALIFSKDNMNYSLFDAIVNNISPVAKSSK
jgi:hypothetical protein